MLQRKFAMLYSKLHPLCSLVASPDTSQHLPAQGGGQEKDGHGGQAHTQGEHQPQHHRCPVNEGEDLWEDHIAGEEECDGDRHDEEDVGPSLLGGGAHELGVVEAEEETDGEEGKEAAVEDLSNEDYQAAVRCKNLLTS